MSDKKLRAQGVIYTTLVDFLLQIVFLLVLLLAPLITLMHNTADVAALKEIHPHVKAFLPTTDSINWKDLELALVPKEIAKAYAADPEKLGKDLDELMKNFGLDPKIASLEDLKKRMANYKVLEEKVARYERGQGRPKCSLALAGDPYVRESQPLLDVVMQAGGFNIKPHDEGAATYMLTRARISMPADPVFKSRAEYLSLMSQVNKIDPTCSHTVRIVADETPSDAKEEYKALLQVIDRTSYKQERILRKAKL